MISIKWIVNGNRMGSKTNWKNTQPQLKDQTVLNTCTVTLSSKTSNVYMSPSQHMISK